MRSNASCALLAIAPIHSSLKSGIKPMYRWVLLRSLCPKSFITAYTLFVLISSVVALQCRSVWKWIWLILGFPKFLAIRFLALMNILRIVSLLDWNTLMFSCGRVLSIDRSFVETCIALGLLPFSGVIEIILCSMSMSVHFRMIASPYRAAVSFKV